MGVTHGGTYGPGGNALGKERRVACDVACQASLWSRSQSTSGIGAAGSLPICPRADIPALELLSPRVSSIQRVLHSCVSCRKVINYDSANSTEDHVHRIGQQTWSELQGRREVHRVRYTVRFESSALERKNRPCGAERP